MSDCFDHEGEAVERMLNGEEDYDDYEDAVIEAFARSKDPSYDANGYHHREPSEWDLQDMPTAGLMGI